MVPACNRKFAGLYIPILRILMPVLGVCGGRGGGWRTPVFQNSEDGPATDGENHFVLLHAGCMVVHRVAWLAPTAPFYKVNIFL